MSKCCRVVFGVKAFSSKGLAKVNEEMIIRSKLRAPACDLPAPISKGIILCLCWWHGYSRHIANMVLAKTRTTLTPAEMASIALIAL